MSVKDAYNAWADQYDNNHNRTRDLEGIALRETLRGIDFDSCLEIGCGTGKNSVWLAGKVQQLTSVDLSEEMLKRAKEKVSAAHVQFIQADITQPWNFANVPYDLVSFSLVLEHIANMEHVFSEAVKFLKPAGHLYLGELHPFKQYSGTKARFNTAEGRQIVECYDHHISDFVQAGKKAGLTLADVNEYFDDEQRSGVPRILTMVFSL